MSSHKNELEIFVADRLKEIYKYSRPTVASGATPAEAGDIKNPYFLLECKIRNTKSFSIKDDVWHRLRGQAALESKDPIYVIQNVNRNRLAVLDFNDWLNMVIELVELRGVMEKLRMATVDNPACFYCGSKETLKFPCCGYFCMKCGKTFEEEEIKDGNNNVPKLQS